MERVLMQIWGERYKIRACQRLMRCGARYASQHTPSSLSPQELSVQEAYTPESDCFGCGERRRMWGRPQLRECGEPPAPYPAPRPRPRPTALLRT